MGRVVSRSRLILSRLSHWPLRPSQLSLPLYPSISRLLRSAHLLPSSSPLLPLIAQSLLGGSKISCSNFCFRRLWRFTVTGLAMQIRMLSSVWESTMNSPESCALLCETWQVCCESGFISYASLFEISTIYSGTVDLESQRLILKLCYVFPCLDLVNVANLMSWPRIILLLGFNLFVVLRWRECFWSSISFFFVGPNGLVREVGHLRWLYWNAIFYGVIDVEWHWAWLFYVLFFLTFAATALSSFWAS